MSYEVLEKPEITKSNAIKNLALGMQTKINELIRTTWCPERNAIDFVMGKTTVIVPWAIKGMKEFF